MAEPITQLSATRTCSHSCSVLRSGFRFGRGDSGRVACLVRASRRDFRRDIDSLTKGGMGTQWAGEAMNMRIHKTPFPCKLWTNRLTKAKSSNRKAVGMVRTVTDWIVGIRSATRTPMLKPRLFTPGPTPVPEETLLELAKPVTYHRTPEQKKVLAEVLEDLKYVYQTKNDVIVLTGSGTGGMEAAVSNVLAPGKKAILLTAGRWGERWRGIMKGFGVTVISVEMPYGKAIPPAQLEDALAKHPDAVAVFATLSETATGVGHDIEAFGRIVAKTPALLVVDGISGLGAMECRTDDWHIDICVAGSQKALMMPPGLAYVAVSAKAWQVIEANTAAKNFYFDLKRYRAK